MKRSIILSITIISALLWYGCTHNSSSHTSDRQNVKSIYSNQPPAFAFTEEMHNFGDLREGDIVTYAFVFKNKGGKDLIIKSVDVGCSCTKAKWPHEAIRPGQEGEIEVTLDTSGEAGNLWKVVFVNANTVEQHKELSFTANVF
ncbi:MAG: DUF1573 domain-containing protein [Bacteroidota bacterium]|nr:DUF1573 domain-containing protein [Bacteroidota bacterium]